MFGYEFADVLDPAENTTPKETQEGWEFSWSGIVGAVKTVTNTAVTIIKEDLNEIADATQELAKETGLNEAISKVKATATSMEGKENEEQLTINDYVGRLERLTFTKINQIGTGVAKGLNEFLNVGDTGTDPKSITNRTDGLIFKAGVDENTYINPYPVEDENAKKRYQLFKESFDQIAHAGKISGITTQQPLILDIQSRLVPKIVSEDDFWVSYFFMVSEYELAQKQREQIIIGDLKEEEIGWSSDEELDFTNADEPATEKVVKEKDPNVLFEFEDEISSVESAEIKNEAHESIMKDNVTVPSGMLKDEEIENLKGAESSEETVPIVESAENNLSKSSSLSLSERCGSSYGIIDSSTVNEPSSKETENEDDWGNWE